MKKMKIGRHLVPVWIIVVLLIFIIGAGIIVAYVWTTLNIPVHVNEPLRILSYPSEFNMYPGDNETFDVRLQNYASNNYTLLLVFSFSNSTFQSKYVSFSNTVYTIVPGQQNITAWFSVRSSAPPTSDTLSIDFEIIDGFDYSGLLAHWKFDEGSGNITRDSSGNSKDGILYGPTWVDGVYGKALSFDGEDDYVAIPDLYSTSPSELTVSAWTYYSSTTSWAEVIHQVRHGEFTMGRIRYGVIAFGVILTDGNAYTCTWNLDPYTLHQVVGTWRKGDSVKLYIDGVLVNQTAVPDAYMRGSDTGPDAAIGSAYGTERFFDGTIDEVMVYDRALNAHEVALLHALPPP